MNNSNGFLKSFVLYVPVKLLPAILTVGFIFVLYRFFPPGEYVAYSVSLSCSLIVAQLSAMWVGNSFVYFYSGVDDKRSLFSSCAYLLALLGPVSAVVAGLVASVFTDIGGGFFLVWVLCVTQIAFFFMSSVCQAAFMVSQQFAAVCFQALVQAGVIWFLSTHEGVSYKDAMISLGAGYGVAALIMLIAVVSRLGLENPFSPGLAFTRNLKAIYGYGSALAPWMLGMLVMVSADRFAISYLNVGGGDSYLSLKDLFVGAGGLLSMPLLMLVHPLLIKRFREGVFESELIQSSMSFLIIVFTLLWALLALIGFQLFEKFTNKLITANWGVLLVAYLGVFLNCSAVYVQKRLEVHKRMRLLAGVSIASAGLALVLAYVGAWLFGLYGAALGGMLGQLVYFAIVGATVLHKVNLYRGIIKPFMLAICALVFGYFLHVIVLKYMSASEWWVGIAAWTAAFTVISLLVLWRGVAWKSFLTARM